MQPTDDVQCLDLSKAKLEEAKRDLATLNGWELVQSESGISGYKIDVPNDANKKVKGGGIIKTKLSPKEYLEWFFSYLIDEEKRKAFDPLCNKREVVYENKPNELKIYHVQYTSPSMMVSHRDTVMQIQFFHEDNASYSIGVEVDHPSLPQSPSGYVRMKNKLNCMMAKKKNDGELEVWNISHFDPSGYVPAWIVNAQAVGEASMFLVKVKQAAEAQN
ncbi:hypothetical protein AKO1_012890 [Acrasis kona]|uniref:START domain-containing protein n=1 Tax=Acrasis kona TaxID=1008807 RepID=A0AAW2YUK5_9EUKA